MPDIQEHLGLRNELKAQNNKVQQYGLGVSPSGVTAEPEG